MKYSFIILTLTLHLFSQSFANSNESIVNYHDQLIDPQSSAGRDSISMLPYEKNALTEIIGKSFFSFKRSNSNDSFDKSLKKIFINILKTKKGKEICQKTIDGDLSKLAIIYGLSKSYAQELSSYCGGGPLGLFWSTKGMIYSESLIKRFDVLFVSENTSEITSWTAPVGTLLIVDLRKNVEQQLYQAIAHELAMFSDNKIMPLDHPAVVKALQSYSRFDNKQQSIKRALMSEDIRLTFNTIRAFTVENEILSELGIKSEVDFKNSTCSDKVLFTYPLIKKILEKKLISFDLLKFARGNRFYSFDVDNENYIDLLLKESMPYFSGKYCDFLAMPDFSGQYLNKFDPGPRPRIGDGTGE